MFSSIDMTTWLLMVKRLSVMEELGWSTLSRQARMIITRMGATVVCVSIVRSRFLWSVEIGL